MPPGLDAIGRLIDRCPAAPSLLTPTLTPRLAVLASVRAARPEGPRADRAAAAAAVVLLVHIERVFGGDGLGRAVGAGRGAFRRVHGDDAAIVDALPEHCGQRVPEPIELGAARERRPLWVDAVHEERFGAVHVADAAEDLLVEQGRGDGDRAPRETLPGAFRIGVAVQDVRPAGRVSAAAAQRRSARAS